ncbi:MAG TPA: hypothetical protein EYH34_00860 [Planctomycetes bacterium]|nr:hypothetical protein [Planctomycetota bacterium]
MIMPAIFSGTGGSRVVPPGRALPWPVFPAFLLFVWTATVRADDPVVLRMESLLLTPTHGPSLIVVAKNPTGQPYRGVLTVEAPKGWVLEPPSQPLELGPGEVVRRRYQVRRGVYVEENRYPVTAIASGMGATVRWKQHLVAATAPYFKPAIDGKLDDWKDSVPVSFLCRGKRSVIRTYWNRRYFAMLVAVEEERLIGRDPDRPQQAFDAIQVAIAPRGAATGRSPDEQVQRYELLFAPEADAARAFRLAEPGMTLAQTRQIQSLAGLEYDQAAVVVSRRKGVTYYECSIPFGPMRRRIRPTEGREFCLSVLIHDPDGTGLRDWGEAAGLWPDQRRPLAWSRWPGARWGPQPPFDSKTPWGLCSSKY